MKALHGCLMSTEQFYGMVAGSWGWGGVCVCGGGGQGLYWVK